MLLWCSFSPVKSVTLEKLLDYRNIRSVKVSPDGTRAVFVVIKTDFEENTVNPDLWLVDFSSSHSFQLTRSLQNESNPAWSPDGRQIAFISNRSGSNQIWVISPDGGEAELATKFEKLNVRRFQWMPDRTGFLFIAPDPPEGQKSASQNKKNKPILVDKHIQYSRLYQYKFGEGTPKKLTTADFHVSSFDVSSDGKAVVFSAYPTPRTEPFMKSDLKLLDMQSGEIRDLVTQPGQDIYPQFSPTGKWIAFISQNGKDENIGNTYLQIVRPDGSMLQNLTESFDERISNFMWGPDESHLFFLAIQGISTKVFQLHVPTRKYNALKALDGLQVCHGFSFCRDGQLGAAIISDANAPSEVYLLKNAGSSRMRLTQINSEFIKLAPKTEVLKYQSKDGLEIEALVIKPKDFEEGKRYPLLVIVHGGPEGVFNYGFYPRRGAYPFFAFADEGYVLLLPNPRGSGGYGEEFRRANYEDFGGGDYRDIMEGVDLLIKQGIADEERMGLMGWSYGGYMAFWVVTQTDRFKAISAGAGVSNLYTEYYHGDNEDWIITSDGVMVSHYSRRPWKDPMMYLKNSAINFIGNAKTPLLIQHGELDRRVPISQSVEFYLGAKMVGFPVEMVVYPKQGHGIREPSLVLKAMEKNLQWFNKWLLGGTSPK
jgi:dipeptidyl aminopeptidase/acylaminoacyl peptidase